MSLEDTIKELSALIQEDIAVRKEAIALARGGSAGTRSEKADSVKEETPEKSSKGDEGDEKPRRRGRGPAKDKGDKPKEVNKAELVKLSAKFLDVDHIKDEDEADELYEANARMIKKVLRKHELAKLSEADDKEEYWLDLVEGMLAIEGFPKP